MTPTEFADQYLTLLDSIQDSRKDWYDGEIRTHQGEQRDGLASICRPLFVPFVDLPPFEIIDGLAEVLRRRREWPIQQLVGITLLSLVPQSYGHLNSIFEALVPTHDLHSESISAYFVEQLGLEAVIERCDALLESAETEVERRGIQCISMFARAYDKKKHLWSSIGDS